MASSILFNKFLVRKLLKPVKVLGIFSFKSLCEVANIVQANYTIHHFFQEIKCSEHRFHVNCFLHCSHLRVNTKQYHLENNSISLDREFHYSYI